MGGGLSIWAQVTTGVWVPTCTGGARHTSTVTVVPQQRNYPQLYLGQTLGAAKGLLVLQGGLPSGVPLLAFEGRRQPELGLHRRLGQGSRRLRREDYAVGRGLADRAVWLGG